MKRVVSLLLVLMVFVTVFTFTINANRDVKYEEILAEELKELGLFKGVSETEFDLKRAPTRVEALVMLIRVLGKEKEASTSECKHSFTDVPLWANNYVGYAYENGLTKGISPTEFGTGDASAAMYLTFVLRALGYSDVNDEDFSWNNPYNLATAIGILPAETNITNFWRADVVLVSYAALSSKLKDADITLGEKLSQSGAFTREQYNIFKEKSKVDGKVEDTLVSLSPEEIYEKCSPAVFEIVVNDCNNSPLSLGSGFFVTSTGIAITNYHVFEGGLSATIDTVDGKTYEVEGILDYSKEKDYCIFKVNGLDFPVLKIGDSSKIKGGERVFTIGNPQGLTNTISDGIVSNPQRDDYSGMIQITAPISHGSSGGALINEQGEVVGITTAGIDSGQNLNFAIPIKTVISNTDLQNVNYEKLRSFFDFATEVEYLIYEDIPDAFEYQISEVEPNDDYDVAQYIENGTSISGKMDDEHLDLYHIRCNTPGLIKVILFSKSPVANVKDLNLMIMPFDLDPQKGALSDLYHFIDGSAGRSLYCKVYVPGSYYITINRENSNYETEYDFYYEFIPGELNAENSSYKEYYVSDDGSIIEPDITYYVSPQSVILDKGKSVLVSFDCSTIDFPSNYTLSIDTSDKRIATAKWADPEDDSLPWEILITGVSAGTTDLIVYNSYNNQYTTIPITVNDMVDPNIEYYTSFQSVTLEKGKSVLISFDCETTDFPSDYTVSLDTGDKGVAVAKWADPEDDSLPWEILITGVSTGTTYLIIYNSYNDQYCTVPITIKSDNSIYDKLSSATFPLLLFANDGTFLGELTTDEYDSDSISNEYGTHGSKYSDESIFNEYGKYGSDYSSESAFYKYATSPPIVLDSKGNFIAYLTANTSIKDGITFVKLIAYLYEFDQ